jgi:hypothetical protein
MFGAGSWTLAVRSNGLKISAGTKDHIRLRKASADKKNTENNISLKSM